MSFFFTEIEPEKSNSSNKKRINQLKLYKEAVTDNNFLIQPSITKIRILKAVYKSS